MDFAFQYIKDNGGIDTEKSYPYEAEDDKCRYNPVYRGATDIGFVDVPAGDENALKSAIATQVSLACLSLVYISMVVGTLQRCH